MFFLAEYANMVAASAMIVTLFLGGWSLPFLGLNEPADTWFVGLVHIGVFLGKMFAVLLVFIWMRWMLPRFRYDQLMDLGWKRFVPLALANVAVTAILLWLQAP
jgi:NADH-quinone oxidoreductase subunit H